MKVFFFLVFLFLIKSNFYCQETHSNPIYPGMFQKHFAVGVYGGEFIPLNPNILVNPPLLYSKTVEPSLANGLNGIGYGTSLSIGASLMYCFHPNFYLSFEGNYSKWKSNNSMSLDNEKNIYSENSMSLVQMNLGVRYYFNENFYVIPEIALNMIPINVKENGSRGAIDFSKTYYRVGGGFGIGVNFPILNNIEFDACGKAQVLNFLLNRQDDPNTTESEALITSYGNTKEEIINMISLRIGFIINL